MIIRRPVPVDQLVPGMVADRDIDDRLGRNLIARCTVLNDTLIESLKKLHIESIYIQENDGDDDSDLSQSSLAVQAAYEQFHAPDPASITLSDSVRNRVSEGIKFIYQDIHSEEITNAANLITTDLMNAIDSNNAIAVDISALKTSDEYTFQHSVDVATISMIIAKKLGYSAKDIYDIGLAGLLHDIGKAEIPPQILNKPGRLTTEEFEVMKTHPVIAYRTLCEKKDISSAIAISVLQHHEKMDGSGYPLHLQGSRITPFARILAVADIYDALVTERPYKSAYSQRDAVEMIMSMVKELDIEPMQAFLHTTILYPANSIVKLSTGEKARVLKNDSRYILRPTVVGLKSGRVYHLGDDLACANVVIA